MQQSIKMLCVLVILALQCTVPYLILVGPKHPSRLQVKKMRRINYGLHDFVYPKGKFPAPAIYSEDWRPLLSWRVTILPHLGYQELFNKFRLDEPWDSLHNKSLLKEMPWEYSDPYGRIEESGLTRLKFIVGEDCVFYPHPRTGRLRGSDIGFINGRDGTANVLVFAETNPPIPWTKPEDLNIDIDGPLPALSGPFQGGFLAASADARIHWIKDSISPEDLRNIFSFEDGDDLQLTDIKDTKVMWAEQ